MKIFIDFIAAVPAACAVASKVKNNCLKLLFLLDFYREMRAAGINNRGVMERKRQLEIGSEEAKAASNCAIQITVKNFDLSFETFFADVAFGRRTRCLLPDQQT
jgi:hypothetical protein